MELTKDFIGIGLIILVVTIMYFVGYRQAENNYNLTCPSINAELFLYECPTTLTLDYEFNCQHKFVNMSGTYCLDNSTTQMVCQSTLKENKAQ